ncbi:helicase C-terminal domain-containing protein, partial [Bacillus cereus]|nr:helicase C-terminal domain-containing protein [Bacillus cereus]
VHKSQGSEYERVALFVESQEELNTNNLLYTAVTRAKKDIKVFVPNDLSFSHMVYNIPKSVSHVNINNVFQLINGIMDIKKENILNN